MANVSDREDLWAPFFNGIQALQKGASDLAQINIANKRMELESATAALKYKQDQESLDVSQTQSLANLINSLSNAGKVDIDEEVLQQKYPWMKGFEPITREEQRATGRIKVEEIKIHGKLMTQEQKAAYDKALQDGKEAGLNERQSQELGIKAAEKLISPAQAATGALAVQSVGTKGTPVIPEQPIMTKQNTLGQIKLGEVNIPEGDIVNILGADNYNAPRANLSNKSPKEFLQIASQKLQSLSGKDREAGLKALETLFPELKKLLEKMR